MPIDEHIWSTVQSAYPDFGGTVDRGRTGKRVASGLASGASVGLTGAQLGTGTSALAVGGAVVTGAAAFILTVFTDHKTGVVRILPYRLHVAVDRVVGLVFVAAPFLLGFHGLDAWYYWANGTAVLLVTFVLNAPEGEDRAMKSAHA